MTEGNTEVGQTAIVSLIHTVLLSGPNNTPDGGEGWDRRETMMSLNTATSSLVYTVLRYKTHTRRSGEGWERGGDF